MKKWKKDSRYWGAGEIYREGNPWVDKEMAEEILNIASSCYCTTNLRDSMTHLLLITYK